MKLLTIILAAMALNSCNTFIGIGRDSKLSYQWTRDKMQGAGDSGEADPSGAPVY